MNEFIGVICGFTTALFASISYIMSRRFTSAEGRTPHQLMALAHVVMGIVSVLLLPFVYIAPHGSLIDLALPLMGAVGTYFIAQFLLFAILKRFTASNIAPMLGLKLVVAGLISFFVLGTALNTYQVVALGLAVCATLILRDSSEGVTFFAVLWVVGICICYSVSDFSISYLTIAIDPEKGFGAVVMSLVLCYIAAAIYPLVFFREVKQSVKQDWKDASCYALSWYVCMLFLFTAFANLGVVYANVLQSTRSVIAVALGVILARMGYSKLEDRVSFSMRVRQFAAAVLMVIAVYVYSKYSG